MGQDPYDQASRGESQLEDSRRSSRHPSDVAVSLRNDLSLNASQLHEEFARPLTAIIRQRIHSRLQRRIDPEDVVQSAFRSFFRILQGGDPTDVANVDKFWSLLYRIALNKLYSQIRFHSAAKRHPVREIYEPNSIKASDPQLVATVVIDELQAVMQSCSAYHRQILELLMTGRSEQEVADEVQCSSRTVYRVIERVTELLKARLRD